MIDNGIDNDSLGPCPLFAGIQEAQLSRLVKRVGKAARYDPGRWIVRAGDPVQFGVVVSGSVHISREDMEGRRAILARLEPGELFGETFVCAGVSVCPVWVMSDGARVLLLDYAQLTAEAEPLAPQIARNLLAILAQKNLYLNGRLEVLAAGATRQRVLVYLGQLAQVQRSRVVTLPFTREELADYLSVNRSALSRELGRMAAEGIIRYHKGRFELLQP